MNGLAKNAIAIMKTNPPIETYAIVSLFDIILSISNTNKLMPPKTKMMPIQRFIDIHM